MGRGVSDEEWAPIWEELESQGWRFEAVAGQQYFLPPGVIRGDDRFKSRRDYFDSKTLVMKHLQVPGYTSEGRLGYLRAAADIETTAASSSQEGASEAAEQPAVVRVERRAKRSSAVLAAAALKEMDKKQKKPRNKAEECAKVTNATGNKLKIHFQGFAQRFDQWMDRDLAHLQPHGTKANGSAKVEGGEKMQSERRQSKRPRTEAPTSVSTTGDPPEIVGDMTCICVGTYRLKIGLLDPPRVVIRDLVSFVCELTDPESAALNIKSLARAIQYEKLKKSLDTGPTVVVSLERLHEVLHICATFRGGQYRSKVMNLLKPGNMVLPRLYAMARAVSLFKIPGTDPPFAAVTSKTVKMIGLPAVSVWFKGKAADEAWYFGEVTQQNSSRVIVRYYDDDTETSWKYSELLANYQNNDGYVLPHEFWEAQLNDIQSRKKHWTTTIDTNAMAAVFEKRIKAMKPVRRDKPGGGAGASGSRGKGGRHAAAAGAAASGKHTTKWSPEELADLREMVAYRGNTDWAHVARELGTGRSPRAVMDKWAECKQAQERLGTTGEVDDMTDAAMQLVIAAAGGRGGGDEDDDTTDLLTDGGQYEEHAREKALMLREAGWRPKDGVWHEAVTAEGYRYFVNQTTGESSWDAPAADYGDVVTIQERMAWRDAAYQDRFREQDRAEAETQELEELEAANMGMDLGLAPLNDSSTDDVNGGDDQEERAHQRGMGGDAAAAAEDELSPALLVAQLSTARRKQSNPSGWKPS